MLSLACFSLGKSLVRVNSVKFTRPTLVRLYVTDCHYCTPVKSILEELYDEMGDHLTFADLDCGDHAPVCKSLNPPGYPSLYLWDGLQFTQHTGDRTKHVLRFWLEEHLRQTAYVPVQSVEEAARLANASGHAAYFLFEGRAYPSVLNYFRGKYPFYFLKTAENDSILRAFRDGFPYTFSGPVEEGVAVRRFVRQNRNSHVTELNESTFYDFAHRKTAVLMLRPEDGFALVEELRRDAPGKLPLKAPLAYMDAVKWAVFLEESFGLTEENLPAVVYFDPEDESEYSTALLRGRPAWQAVQEAVEAMEAKQGRPGLKDEL